MEKKIESFTDLRVYQAAFELQQETFQLSKLFPFASFVNKLTDADGEQAETQHWLRTAKACAYLSTKQHDPLLEKYLRIGQMLGSMLSKPESFCP